MKKRALSVFVGLLLATSAGSLAAGDVDVYSAFQEARKLEHEGKDKEAFLKYLAVPGGEFAAASLARGNAREFLAVLRQNPRALESPRAALVEADLLLASAQPEQAKQRYHQLAATAPAENWGAAQPGFYPVEPPQQLGSDNGFESFARGQPALPFSCGPGSHRDNWLLRRLIALDLIEDAAKEFARLWEVHRANTQPYAVLVPRYDEKAQKAGEEKRLVRPHGFNSYGLQFALDYAFFLKRAGRTNDALALLLEPLRVMDMDRNPNLTPQETMPASLPALPVRIAPAFNRFGFGPGTVGVSRKEFIRLTHGEFKSAGREPALVAELQQQIDAGQNRARRVLAQVRLHQGQREAALALELDFIQHADLDALTVACRRGLAYEEFQQTAEAVAEFEKAIALKPAPVQLPDAEEQISESPHLQARAFFPGQLDQTEPAPLASLQLQDRLARLYTALGRTDKVLDMELAQCESNESRLQNLATVEQMAQRFSAAGQEARFTEWARRRLAEAKTPQVRANLAWQQRLYAAAITNAATVVAQGGYYSRDEWRERFAKLGRAQERDFLRAVVAANPREAVARLELLDLEDRLDGPEAIAALETLLATDAANAFPRGKGAWNRTHFKNYLDLAYRLMRLYEKNRQLDNLRALGLRLAKGEKPFEKYDQNLYWSLGENGLEEFGNACLALAIQHADGKAYQEELAAALKESRWSGARAQLERRLGRASLWADTGTNRTPALAWANVPGEVRLVASCETVTCLARDERFVYAGQPWGVAVYDFQGAPVTRILLGSEVTTMVVTQQQVWVGTTAGLFRLEAGTWAIAREPLGHVTALALDGEQLWIGIRNYDSVMLMNRRTLSLRLFLAEELGFDNRPATRGPPAAFSRFESDHEYVWAEGSHGLLRYDRAAEAWSAPENPGPQDPLHLVGVIDGQVWADVYLNDELRHRPARVDRRTLRITPIQLGGNVSRDQRLINGGFAFLGKDKGRLVFAADWGPYFFDETANQIRRMPETDSGVPGHISDPLPEGMLLPDGTMVRNGLPNQARGGLYFVMPDGQFHRVSLTAWPDGLQAGVLASAWADRWPSDAVWAVLFDDARQQEWLCFGAGLAVLRRGETTLQHFTSPEGVCCGPVIDGVALAGRLYFASGWDNSRGGLIVFDPETRVFTSYFRSDGMSTDNVVGLAVKDGQLELRYGLVRNPNAKDDFQLYLQYPPSRFDPATGQFTSGGEPEIVPRAEGEKRAGANIGTLPFLGGPAYRRYERDGKTWLCGSRGLVIFSGKDTPALAFASLNAQRIPNRTQELTKALREEAARVHFPNPISAAQLKELVTHTNRYVRANALAAAMTPVLQGGDEYVLILADCVRDPYSHVRSTAVWLLSRSKGDAVLPPLRQALGDSDLYIRAVAALALANHGEVPPLSFFEDIIQRNYGFGNFPFGADSSVGVEADAVRAYAALAPHADRKIFEFLVQLPPPNHDDIKKLYPALGASLRQHPEAADVLLTVQDTERWGPLRAFVQAIFQQAGKEMLPALHRALASQDRVVRSNAARACGAIGDPSSIPYLIQALDMESGLARASIVWALGELKARESLPRQAELYADARNADHNRHASAGFLAQQAKAAYGAEYTALRNLDAIASDWDELKVVALHRPRDPRRDEELLTAEQVLEAVRKIGPEQAQAFYRALAGATDAGDRAQAALGLGAAAGSDQESSRSILRNLRGDAVSLVRVSATVSLIQLGEDGVEPALLERLKNADNAERREILDQLARLPAARLEFFRKEIETIAANDREPEHMRSRASALIGKLRENRAQ
jgi:HEAT repeat protein